MFKSFSGFSVFNWGVEIRLSPTKPYVLLCSNVHSFILGVEFLIFFLNLYCAVY